MPLPTGMKIEYHDLPDLPEIFADSSGLGTFDGQTLRIELRICRVQEAKPPAAPMAKQYPVARLVLPPDLVVELANKLNQMLSIMVAQGTAKKAETPPKTMQ